MKKLCVCLLLICVANLALAESKNNDESYDGWMSFDIDLSDVDNELFDDSITDMDETRQYMGPRRRRQRLLKLQGKYFWTSRIHCHSKYVDIHYFLFRFKPGMANELKGLSHCWKMHLQCSHMIPQEQRYGLTNDDIHSVWHCDCSMEFLKCFQRINSFLSKQIGELYFSANSRCYRTDYKIVECLEYDVDEYSKDNKRCIHYLQNVSYPMELQWFDLPFYSKDEPKDPLFTV